MATCLPNWTATWCRGTAKSTFSICVLLDDMDNWELTGPDGVWEKAIEEYWCMVSLLVQAKRG